MSSKYFEELIDNEAKIRYMSKIAVIGDIDPYSLTKSDLKTYAADFPEINYFDIVNYLVYGKSFYTQAEFKSYKSLEAYKQFACNWIKDISSLKIADFHLVIGKVLHSQSLSEKPLQPWIIVEQTGVVQCAHCTCMAGLGEACTHVAALMFFIEHHVRNKETVTSLPAYWMDPGLKSAKYAEVKNIDFSTATKILQKKDMNTCSSNQSSALSVPKLTDAEFSDFLKKLHEAGSNSAILNVVKPYSLLKEQSSVISSKKHLIFSNFYDETNLNKSLPELQELGRNLHLNLSVNEAIAIEEETKLQTKSKLWFQYRAGRITASNMKAACCTNIKAPAISTIKSICYPSKRHLKNKAINWGCKHENEARIVYTRISSLNHDSFTCEKSGLIINPKLPYLGASPDGLISCSCCGEGTLEIKCPYCFRDCTEKGLLLHGCLMEEDGKTVLSKKHAYYYQVQMQIFLSERKYCDFVLWSPNDTKIIRVEPDTQFWKVQSEKLELFFYSIILPEMMGKAFTRPSAKKEDKKPHLVFL